MIEGEKANFLRALGGVRGLLAAVLAGLLAAALGGCSVGGQAFPKSFGGQTLPQITSQEVTGVTTMLSAAGFRALPADNPKRKKQLAALQPFKLEYYLDEQGNPHYWYADPNGCNCLYVGNQADYQKYENLVLQNQVLENQQQAQILQQQQMMMMQQQQMMGPFGAGGPFGGPFGFGIGGPGAGFVF